MAKKATETVVETNEQKGLMKKTKQMLVDIILRKDSVETELRDVNKSLSNEVETWKAQVKQMKKAYDELKSDYKTLVKTNDSIKADMIGTAERISNQNDLINELRKDYKFASNASFILAIALIASIIAYFIL